MFFEPQVGQPLYLDVILHKEYISPGNKKNNHKAISIIIDPDVIDFALSMVRQFSQMY